MKCVQVTVHLAFVGLRAFLGYPFRARHGLTLSPAQCSLLFDDVPHEEHIPDEPSADVEVKHSGVEPEVQNLMDQDQLADSDPISQVKDQDQLTECSPIFHVHEVSNTPHLQSQNLDIKSDDADQSGRHPKRVPTPNAVIVSPQSNQGMSPEPAEWEPLVSPEPSGRGGEEKAWIYYIDIAAVQDYPEEQHAKTEDGDDPSSDGSSDEGSLVFNPPLKFMGNFGYLCDSEGRMEMLVDYVGADPLNRQQHVSQEHPPDVEVDTQDVSKDPPGDTLLLSPVFDGGGNREVQRNQAHIVSRKPA